MELFIDDTLANYFTYFKKTNKVYVKKPKIYIYSFTYNGKKFI